MKKHPKLSLAIAGLVVLGAALVIAQTNQTAGVTNGACCATFANPAMFATCDRNQCADHRPGKEAAAKTA